MVSHSVEARIGGSFLETGDGNGSFKEESTLVEKYDKFIQMKTISIIMKSSWGAPQTLHSLQTSLLCSPTPSDALAGVGRLLLTLVG